MPALTQDQVRDFTLVVFEEFDFGGDEDGEELRFCLGVIWAMLCMTSSVIWSVIWPPLSSLVMTNAPSPFIS